LDDLSKTWLAKLARHSREQFTQVLYHLIREAPFGSLGKDSHLLGTYHHGFRDNLPDRK